MNKHGLMAAVAIIITLAEFSPS